LPKGHGLSNQTNRPVRIQARARWATNGAVTLAAEGTLLPATATVTMAFEHARLPVLQPYVEDFVNLNIHHGEASGRWTLEYNRKPGGPLITVEGGMEVQDFLAFDTLAGRDFLKWEELQLREVKAAWEPGTLHLAEIYLRQPATSFVLMTNGLLNIQSLWKGGLPTNSPSGSASSSPRSLQLWVDRLTLTNASVYVADRTVPGEFSTTLERFSGFVTDLAWPLKKSRVELAGFVGARAPFTVEGWILPDPERQFLDMHVTTTNAEVIPFTPYAIKFVGYPLLKGRLTADVTYRVDGQQLQGENLILVDQLTLGPQRRAQPLLDLPVKLGIALLKDSQGRITLDIPVKGRLDDPEFGVGKVVWQAVKGLFAKVATAPFKLLGSLFGGSEDEGQALQRVEFAAGTTQLAPAATNQLERLVTALGKRPELLLVVRGGASPEEDGPALALDRLETRLQELRWAELSSGGTSKVERKPLTLSAEERGRLLGVLFTNTFPLALEVVSPNKVADPGATVDPAVSPKAAPTAQEKFQVRLLEQLQPAAEELSCLRASREEVVRTWLLSANRLSPERLVVPEPGNTNESPVIQRVVEFSLE